MIRFRVGVVILGMAMVAGSGKGPLLAQAPPEGLAIDYPSPGSIFPPDISAPMFLWRDATPNVTRWRIEITFADGGRPIHVESAGELMRVGEIDERCIAPTNKLPELTPLQAVSHTWTPAADPSNVHPSTVARLLANRALSSCLTISTDDSL